MNTDLKNSDFARGEARSKIHWGADIPEVVELLESKYGIAGAEAENIIAAALCERKAAIRKKAAVALGFALVGLGVSVAYFAIQLLVGFVRIGLGSVLMALLGLACAVMAARTGFYAITGEKSGPV